MGNGIKEAVKTWGLVAVGIWFVLAPYEWHLKVPIVQNFTHPIHQAYGLGILTALSVAWLLTRWK